MKVLEEAFRRGGYRWEEYRIVKKYEDECGLSKETY
jgi:hypothetical protein